MENPTIPLDNPRPSTPTKRKRSRSSLEIFTLSPPYDTKRARIGIQELSTDPKPKTLLSPIAWPSSSDGAESQDEDMYSSSGLEDSEEATSSSDESSTNGGHDEGYDSDSESGSTTTSSSSSSSDSEEDSDDEETSSRTATIGFPSPEINRFSTFRQGSSSLITTLNSFLPRMAAANAELDKDRDKGLLAEKNIEDVNEGERYIEMNLGLGVLEEKQRLPSNSSDNDGDESDAGSGQSWTKTKSKKHDAMAVLMGKKGDKKPEIEVVDD